MIYLQIIFVKNIAYLIIQQGLPSGPLPTSKPQSNIIFAI